ncbi:MAG: CBS domain-containing protein [Bacteroidetes bacterium]|nr:CBS domain-containing protein [Bacteroidota bacterium]MCW5893967.1 CBS domain-containing protein [Bacteroidota bacterium]
MTSIIKQLLEHRPLLTIDKDASVQMAAEYMAKNNIGALPVVDAERLVGVFSERDVINRVVVRNLVPAQTRVADVMTTNIVVAESDETYEDCLKKMKQASCRHLPVVEGEALVGFISLRDLLQVDIHEKDDKIEFLNHYMFHVPAGMEKKYER